MSEPLLTRGDKVMHHTRRQIVHQLRTEFKEEGPAIIARMLLSINTDDPLALALIEEAASRLSPNTRRQ